MLNRKRKEGKDMNMNEHQTFCITDKGIAYLAALHAGIIREDEADADGEATFERYWTEYTEKSSRNFEKVMQSSTQSIEDLIQMLQSESRERADQRKTQMIFAILFSCSFMFGALLVMLL